MKFLRKFFWTFLFVMIVIFCCQLYFSAEANQNGIVSKTELRAQVIAGQMDNGTKLQGNAISATAAPKGDEPVGTEPAGVVLNGTATSTLGRSAPTLPVV